MSFPVVIVDEEDEPIGVKDLFIALSEGYIRRVVYVLVFNARGELLVQKRSKFVRMAGKLDQSAGGHVHPGERYIGAACRRLWEELGVQVDKGRLSEVASFYHMPAYRQSKTGHAPIFCKVYEVDYEGPIVPNDREVESVQWCDISGLKSFMRVNRKRFTPRFIDLCQRYNGGHCGVDGEHVSHAPGRQDFINWAT